jgi:gluconolactonase
MTHAAPPQGTPAELLEVYQPEMRQLVDSGAELEQVADGFVFTEGPVWDFSRHHLLFSDLAGDAMYRYEPGSGISTYRKPSSFSNGTALDAAGRLVVCEHRSRRVAREEEPGLFVDVATSYAGQPLNAPNDVVVAADGSIVFTDPHYGLQEGYGGPAEQILPHRGVYRVPPDDGEPELLVDDLIAPNGLALDPTGRRLLVVDTERSHIRVFGIAEDWTVSGGTVFAEIAGDGPGVPDGMKLDLHGRVFCTGPGGIHVLSPTGTLLGRIRIPVVAANLAWGSAGARTMYVTASDRLYRLHTRTEGFAPHRQDTTR